MGAFAKNAVLKHVVAPTFRSARRARAKTADPSLPSGQALKVGGTKAAALHYIPETKGVSINGKTLKQPISLILKGLVDYSTARAPRLSIM